MQSPPLELSLEDSDLPILNEVYLESHHDNIERLSQHCPTSPPIQHTNLTPKSNFNPVTVHNMTLHTDYQVVYSNFNMCKY